MTEWNPQPNPGEGRPEQPSQPGYSTYGQPPPSQPGGYQQYPGAPGGNPYGPSGYGQYPQQQPQSQQSKSFFAALFDYGFTSFAGPTVIKVLYVLITIGLGLAYLGYVIAAFAYDGALGILVLIGGAILALIYLAFSRVTLEVVLAVLRMSEDLKAIRQERRL